MTSARTAKPTRTKRNRAKLDDRTLATKLHTAKRPDTLLEANGGKPIIWRLLQCELVSLDRPELASIAAEVAEEVDANTIIAVASKLPEEAFCWRHLRWLLNECYNADSAAWEAALATMPDAVRDLLAPRRACESVTMTARDKERALERFAQAAFDGVMSRTTQIVEALEPSRAFRTRLLGKLADHPDQPPNRDIGDALAIAPWETVLAMVARHGISKLGECFLEAMTEHEHSAAQHLELLSCHGHEIDHSEAIDIARRAYRRREVLPAIEHILIGCFADGWVNEPEDGLVLEALTEPRRSAFVAAVKETGTRDPRCAFLLEDRKLDDELVAALVDAVDRTSWVATHRAVTGQLRKLLPNREHGAALIDRAWQQLATDASFAGSYEGHQLRLLFRRVKFMCSRYGEQRPWELVLPNADLVWANHVDDMIGSDDAFSGMSDAEVQRLLDAYLPHDWDGRLGVASRFRSRFPDCSDDDRPSIEAIPWEQLVALIAQTSFGRLADGERKDRTLTRVFARSEPLAARIELAEAIARREADYSRGDPSSEYGLAAIVAVLTALAPHLIAHRQAVPPALADSVLRLLKHDIPDSVRDLVLSLPRGQVDGWLAALCADPAVKLKRRGKAYAKLVTTHP